MARVVPASGGSPQLVTVDEAASALSIGRTTVYHLMNVGRLRSVKVGRARRIPADALAELVADLESEGSQR